MPPPGRCDNGSCRPVDRRTSTRRNAISDLIKLVTGSLGGGGLNALAGLIGADEAKTSTALTATLSVLTGALARNSEAAPGAASLDTALEKDHDGGILSGIGDFLGNVAAGPGAGILGHVLGSRQQPVAQEIAKTSGLDLGQAMTMMTVVAPLLMGALGKKKREEGLDAAGVSGILAAECQQVEQQPGLGGLLGVLTQSEGGGDTGGLLSKLSGLLGFLKRGK